MRGIRTKMMACTGLGIGAAAIALVAAGCSFDVTGLSDTAAQGDGGGGGGGGGAVADAGPGTPIVDARRVADAAPRPPDAMQELPGDIIARSAGTIDLDGSSADWGGARWQVFGIGDAAQTVACGGGYRPSSSARFASLHDDQYLYFFFEVTDDEVNFDSSDLFEDDAINLYLDARGDRSGPFGDDDHEIVVSAEGLFADYATNNPTSAATITLNGSVVSTNAGFNIEIRVEKSSLGAGALPSALGFNLALSDDDDIGGTAADCYGLWFESSVPRCADCCDGPSRAWCDTTLHGRLLLR